jgi:2-succinyl-5-enolpyruvyl-6-hydroxy-3-cyclohexene-1-carboxylate synthase
LEACVNARDQTLRAAREVLSSLAFGEAHAVHQVCASLPEGSLFVIGNSLPLRAVDQFAAARPASIVTLVQRGANGIDGLVSGAVGVASKALAPTTLLLGDVSLAHDVGGLSLARELTRSLVIVVIDNAGGRIFDELPWGSAANAPDSVRRYWLTPPQIDFEALARAYAIEHAEVTNAATLAAALGRAYQRNGATLISVRVPPHSYHEARLELRAKCAERLHAEPRAK